MMEDFNGKDTNNNNDTLWEWQDEEFHLENNSGNHLSQCLWDNVNGNDDDNLMYMLEEQTPIKDCAEIGYPLYDVVDNTNKEMEEYSEGSQMKRRRMLQFSDANEMNVGYGQFASVCLKSKARESLMEDCVAENLEWNSQLSKEPQDDRDIFNFEGWNQASDGWLANCVNVNEMQCSLNKMDDSMITDDQVGASEIYGISLDTRTDALQPTPNPSPIKIIKGRNSFLKTPNKLVTPAAYPFALIKPCGVQGDVTLRDINQRIHVPPPRSKNKMDEYPSTAYPTSAFSGKPVVLKTKIRTEGGKGSITILRTKG